MEANHDRDQARFVFQKMLFSIREQQTLNIVELIANLVPAVVDIVQQNVRSSTTKSEVFPC